MEDKKDYKIGDVIPLEQAEKSDTYYLVTINGQKYLVDQKGNIVLKQAVQAGSFFEAGKPSQTPDGGASREADYIPLESQPSADPLKLRIKPGTPEFTQAIQEAENVLLFFLDQVRKSFRLLASRFEVYLEQTRTPYIKYFERGKDGLANIKAYLIREFFSRTNAQERGLEVLEFLTQMIARRIDGSFGHDRQLSPAEQKAMLVNFLDFINSLGDTPMRRQIIAKTYREFINQEFELMSSEGGTGYYIISSLQKALKVQIEFLQTSENRNYLDAAYQRLMRSQMDFFLDNMLSYIKALTILRIISHSSKEERGRDDVERERFFYTIIAFHPTLSR